MSQTKRCLNKRWLSSLTRPFFTRCSWDDHFLVDTNQPVLAIIHINSCGLSSTWSPPEGCSDNKQDIRSRDASQHAICVLPSLNHSIDISKRLPNFTITGKHKLLRLAWFLGNTPATWQLTGRTPQIIGALAQRITARLLRSNAKWSGQSLVQRLCWFYLLVDARTPQWRHMLHNSGLHCWHCTFFCYDWC